MNLVGLGGSPRDIYCKASPSPHCGVHTRWYQGTPRQHDNHAHNSTAHIRIQRRLEPNPRLMTQNPRTCHPPRHLSKLHSLASRITCCRCHCCRGPPHLPGHASAPAACMMRPPKQTHSTHKQAAEKTQNTAITASSTRRSEMFRPACRKTA